MRLALFPRAWQVLEARTEGGSFFLLVHFDRSIADICNYLPPYIALCTSTSQDDLLGPN